MRKRLSLPNGREHELSLGLTVNDEDFPNVSYLSLVESVQEVINCDLYILGDEGEDEEVIYNPSNPTWGVADILFQAVKCYLPKIPKNSLRLYPAIGTSLDVWHGVDYFFVWQNMYYATIDLSLRKKRKKSVVDVLVDLSKLTPDELGCQVASCLLQKRSDREFLIKPNKKKGRIIKEKEKLEDL